MPNILTKEQYLKALHIFRPSINETAFRSFEENFDIKVMTAVNDIIKNSATFNSGKWNYIFNEFKDRNDVMIIALKTGNVPADIVHKILQNTSTFKNGITSYNDMPSMDIEKMKCAVYNKIAPSDVISIYNKLDEKMRRMHSFNHYYGYKETDKINQEVVEFMAEKFAEKYKASKYPTYDMREQLAIFSSIKNENFIKKLCEKGVHEDIVSACINNTNLSNETREYLFTFDYNPKTIDIFTPEMTEQIYNSAIEMLEFGYESENKAYKNGYYDTKHFFYDFISKKVMTEAMELNLAHIIISQTGTAADHVRSELFRQTKHESVLRLAEELKGKDKLTAYENKNMPEDMLRKRVEKMCDTMIKNKEKNEERKTPDVWFEYMKDYCNRITLKDEHYHILLNGRHRKLSNQIASSITTPPHILKEMIADKNLDETSKTIAKVNLFCCEKEIDKGIFLPLTNFFNNSYNYHSEMRAMMENNFVYSGENRSAKLSYANQSLDEILRKNNRQTIEKIVKQLSTLEKKEKNPNNKEWFQYVRLYLHTGNEVMKEIENYKEGCDLSKMSCAALHNILNKLRAVNYHDVMSDMYVKLYEHGEELIKINDEINNVLGLKIPTSVKEERE